MRWPGFVPICAGLLQFDTAIVKLIGLFRAAIQ